MVFITSQPEDGPTEMTLDAEGIDWLVQGLEQLRASDLGTQLTAPSFVEGADGQPSAATEFILRRA